MAALTQARKITSRGTTRQVPVYAYDGYTFYEGGAVVIGADGYAARATKTTSLKTVGLFAPQGGSMLLSSTSGGYVVASSTLLPINCIFGTFDLDCGAAGTADQIGLSDVGALCYWLDDHTVTCVSSGASQAGTVQAINADGTIQVALNSIAVSL